MRDDRLEHVVARDRAVREMAEALARLIRVASVELGRSRPDVIEQATKALQSWEAVQ